HLEVRIERRAVERVAVGLGELAEDRVDRGLAGTERVLVAADTDGFHSRRKVGTHSRSALTALLHRLGHQLLVTASGHEGGGMRRATHSQALKETAARHRHGDSSFSYRRLPTRTRKTCWGRQDALRQVNRTDSMLSPGECQ